MIAVGNSKFVSIVFHSLNSKILSKQRKLDLGDISKPINGKGFD